MVFSSTVFMFMFLPIALILYYLSPRKLKNLVLFLISLFFYAWGEPVLVLLMVFSASFDYFAGLLIEKFRQKKGVAKLVLILSLAVNLGLLGFFKYGNFFLLNIDNFFNLTIPLLDITLPIGISFYTFQTMSYTIDVYRGIVPAQRNYINFGAYVSLFPQLIAGPIVRYKTVADQLINRQHTLELFANGVERFVIGLGKKVLIANNIGFLYDQIQNTVVSGGNLSVATAWLGIIAFALQIYFDFSGYSDMAIGLGKMFGFTFLENFNYPYISRSITEFWRRWHISLSTWFKEYVYIPLGGNRVSKPKLFRNIMLVWGLTGFWHGASWNFLLWGLYFGVILILEKTFVLNILAKLPKFVGHLYAMILVLFSWVIFAFEDVQIGLAYAGKMLGIGANGWLDQAFMYDFTSNWVILVIGIIAALPVAQKVQTNSLTKSLKLVFYGVIFLLAVAYLVDSNYNPFLYFRF